MTVNEWLTVEVEGKGPVSAVLAGPEQSKECKRTGVVLAHGAANDMNNDTIVAVADGLASVGYATLRFNFPYREKGRKSPDTEPTLVRAWQCAVAFLQENVRFPVDRVVAAGKSLGARIASQAVAADQMPVEALIFLGYPLHAPGKQETLRDSHLYEIDQPMLFIEGTRDPFCNLAKLQGVLDRLAASNDIEVIEGGDHSFKVPKSLSRSSESVHRQIVETCLSWLEKTLK